MLAENPEGAGEKGTYMAGDPLREEISAETDGYSA